MTETDPRHIDESMSVDEPMSPEEARVPDVMTRLYPSILFFEWMQKYDTQYIHIFKPVEADVRVQEANIRHRCPALYPLSRDPNIRFIQLEMQTAQDRCDARRMTWRDAGGCAAWPIQMGDLISKSVRDQGLDVRVSRIELIPELDAWNIEFSDGILSEERIERLIEAVVRAFNDLGVKWPREIFE